MGLFGDVDVAEVPDDPFHIDDGVYLAVLTEVKKIQKKDETGWGLSFVWVVNEEDSDFHESRLQDWKNIYPDLTQDDLTKEVKQDLSRLKSRLMQIGVAEDELNEFWDGDLYKNYIGTEAYLTVKNSTDKDDPSKKFRNITWVRLPDISDE